MKNSKSRPFLNAIRDKNLYGRKFFSGSVVFLIFGLFIQYFVYYLLTPHLLILYVPLYFLAILLFSGPFTKNFKREFHPMDLWLAYLMLFTSAFAKAFVLFVPIINMTLGLLQWLLVTGISELAFLFSLVTIVVLSQRVSLRTIVGLSDNFFVQEKNRWKEELEGFPNLEDIVESLERGRFVANLFDKGFFNLTVLWSCNVMEETIDSIAEGIVSKNAEKKGLFKDENGKRLAYPRQLRNLGFNEKNYLLDFENLWHKIRDRIAHHNYKPTYDETKEALKTLITFTREMPNILQNLASSQKSFF